MTYIEIEEILSKILDKQTHTYDKPTSNNWLSLSKHLNYFFSNEFKCFIELMAYWDFPGDIYNVSRGHNNGNDNMQDVYEHEMLHGNWNENMIPFYGIGNGDYFCISKLSD